MFEIKKEDIRWFNEKDNNEIHIVKVSLILKTVFDIYWTPSGTVVRIYRNNEYKHAVTIGDDLQLHIFLSKSLNAEIFFKTWIQDDKWLGRTVFGEADKRGYGDVIQLLDEHNTRLLLRRIQMHTQVYKGGYTGNEKK